MKIATICAFACVSVAPLAVSAQDTDPASVHLTFDGDAVTGTRHGPDGDSIVVRGNAKFDSLIEIRRSFYNEIVESADQFAH
ncbi:MAG: hypothetical protein ACJAYU_004238 [Bradymonadia bacterium]